MKLRQYLWAVPVALLVLIFAILLAAIILLIWLTLWIFDIPNKLGKRWGLDNQFRRVLYRIVDENELEYFRDEFMEVIQSKAEYVEGLESWGLRREIDLERERAIRDLRQGEQIIAIFGGVFTVVIGNGLGLAWGALALTFVTVFYSLAVAFRVLVVDSLAYSGILHREASLPELAKMKSWNEGPLRGTGGVGVVIVSLITSRGSWGEELGMQIMDMFSPLYFDYDETKWQDTLIDTETD